MIPVYYLCITCAIHHLEWSTGSPIVCDTCVQYSQGLSSPLNKTLDNHQTLTKSFSTNKSIGQQSDKVSTHNFIVMTKRYQFIYDSNTCNIPQMMLLWQEGSTEGDNSAWLSWPSGSRWTFWWVDNRHDRSACGQEQGLWTEWQKIRIIMPVCQYGQLP